VGDPRRFEVGGPFPVAVRRSPTGGKEIDFDAFLDEGSVVQQQWLQHKGCYVFALQRGPGYLPVYVGKTEKSFEDECLNSRNCLRLQHVLNWTHGSLWLFLLAYKSTVGKTNSQSIDDLEKYLTRLAKRRNPNLLNQTLHTDPTTFEIQGIDTPGKPSNVAKRLARLLGL
jgi:hypothetical protein